MDPMLVYVCAVVCMVYFQTHSLTDQRVWLCFAVALTACAWEASNLWTSTYGLEGFLPHDSW